MMRALAWDDKPIEYFDRLKNSLDRLGIFVEVVDNEDDFIIKFQRETWDFIITDLALENEPAEGEYTIEIGKRIANLAAKTHPVFIVTGIYDQLQLRQLALPSSVVIRSKDTPPAFTAYEIFENLKLRGLMLEYQKVFLIYGHDAGIKGVTNSISKFLESKGIIVEKVRTGALNNTIINSLLERMHGCGAIVAICTPDDRISDDLYQPRQNVLLEMGMAMGISNGLNRIICLQLWDESDPKRKAQLPSDMGGILTIRFKKYNNELIAKLTEALKTKKIRFADEQQNGAKYT